MMDVTVDTSIMSSPAPHYLDRVDGPIFKFLPNAEYADALCRGSIFLSTLNRCRAYEGLNGDPEEGDADLFDGISG